jgi:predicted NAD/FAD-dependent oxidoreductase
MTTIAVIGAGLAGLVVARELAQIADVVVFEKSRGVGGRLATRRADAFEFDHGAQFFTAKTEGFRAFLEPLIDGGIVADWPARFVEFRRDGIVVDRQWDGGRPHFVGAPAMNAIGKALAASLDVRLETAVRSLARGDERWQLLGDDQRRLGEFDWVVVTAPASQTAELLGSRPIAPVAAGVRMHACYALLLGFDEPPGVSWQAALVHDSDIGWVSVNSSKPGRAGASSLVVHSTNSWADAHVNGDTDAVRHHLATEFCRITGIDAARARFIDVHRWRYANVGRQGGDVCALDAQRRLAACGDWFVHGRVESAYASAIALAERLKRAATPT